MLRANKTERRRMEVKYFIACMCAAIRVWSAAIIATIWGSVQYCPPHNKACWRCVHAVIDLKHGWAGLEVLVYTAGFAKHNWQPVVVVRPGLHRDQYTQAHKKKTPFNYAERNYWLIRLWQKVYGDELQLFNPLAIMQRLITFVVYLFSVSTV